jgi:hypothetical protein
MSHLEAMFEAMHIVPDEAVLQAWAGARVLPMPPTEQWLAPQRLAAACGMLKFADETTAACLRCAAWVAASEAAARFAWLARCRLFPIANQHAAARAHWPVLPAELGEQAGLLYAVVLLSAVDETLAANRARGIDDAITIDTLDDLELWILQHRRDRGAWGFNNIPWLANHFSGTLFRLGRLQFEISTFALDFTVYRDTLDGHVTALADEGGRFRTDGQFDGADGVNSPNVWTATLRQTAGAVTGYPLSPRGSVLRQAVTLQAGRWQRQCGKGDPSLFVHIPAGWRRGPLEAAAVEDSLAQAEQFFPRHFPRHDYRAMQTVTWLLDPQLADHLPADSNIVKFQSFFQLAPVAGASDRQTIERAFGRTFPGWQDAPQDTALRRALVAHALAGGHWRNGGGFRLRGVPG